MASFSVVALMKEEASVVRRFVTFYRGLGAERIFLLHDGPVDHLAAAGMTAEALDAEGVTLVVCDTAFWIAEHGEVPAHVQLRLRAAFAVGHRWCRSDWLLVCDADEFLIDRIPVAAFLDRIPQGVDSVVIRPAEAVWGPGEDIDVPFGSTWFRRPADENLWRELSVYGPFGPFFRRGVLGYPSGKQFVRRGARFDLIRQHDSIRDGKRASRVAATIDPALGQVEMGHFDAISYTRWREKFHRRLRDWDPAAMRERSPRRRAQMRLFGLMLRLGDRATRWMCRRMYGLDRRQIARLERRGLVFREVLFDAEGRPALRRAATAGAAR